MPPNASTRPSASPRGRKALSRAEGRRTHVLLGRSRWSLYGIRATSWFSCPVGRARSKIRRGNFVGFRLFYGRIPLRCLAWGDVSSNKREEKKKSQQRTNWAIVLFVNTFTRGCESGVESTRTKSRMKRTQPLRPPTCLLSHCCMACLTPFLTVQSSLVCRLALRHLSLSISASVVTSSRCSVKFNA